MKGLHSRFFTRRYVTIVLLLFPFLLLAYNGCKSKNRDGEEDSLKNRVKAFWENRIAGDNIKAYEFEEYSKKGSMTAEQYVRSLNPSLHYKTYRIKEMEEGGDNAIVKLDVRYNLSLPARGQFNMTTEIIDQWIRLDGQWYRKEIKKEKSPPVVQ